MLIASGSKSTDAALECAGLGSDVVPRICCVELGIFLSPQTLSSCVIVSLSLSSLPLFDKEVLVEA